MQDRLEIVPNRLILLAVLYAVLQTTVPFLFDIFPSNDGELFYASASIQVSVLSYLVCSVRVQDYRTHLFFFAAILILSLGMACPIAYDRIPYLFDRKMIPAFLIFSIPWYWFCMVVAMSSLYLLQRVILASFLSCIRFLRGQLKFSVVNILVSTVMVFICLTIVSKISQLEYHYATTVHVIGLISLVLTPAAWSVLTIHDIMVKRPLWIAGFWIVLCVGTGLVVANLLSSYGAKLIDLPVYRTLLDGNYTPRDRDAIALIVSPLVLLAGLATVVRPVRSTRADGAKDDSTTNTPVLARSASE